MNPIQTEHPIIILLADDDTDDRFFFDKALKEIPVSNILITVHDGEQLMTYLSENLLHLPHALFLDLNMPLKNGFECLSEIRENETLKELYIIMFSTSFPLDKNYEREMITNLFKIGANDFIRKPSGFVQFKLAIENALKKVKV